jgi:hypothetical protein
MRDELQKKRQLDKIKTHFKAAVAVAEGG